MGWRDNMQPASFRGAPFLVTTSDLAFGRNAQVNEFPLGEQPEAEDLGRKARSWTVEGFVIGDGYMAQRDRLIAAFETPGAGTLIHPWQGTKRVQVRGEGRCRETKDNGGMAVFTVTVVEASVSATPASGADTQTAAASAADATDAQGQTSLTDRLDVSGAPAFVQAGGVGVMGQISEGLAGLCTAASCAGETLWSLRAGVSGLALNALALLATPASLVAAMQALLAQAVGLSPYPLDALAGLLTLAAFAPPSSPATTTTSGQIEASNQSALCQVLQAAACAAAVRVTSGLDFDSYDQAAATRQQVCDAVDDAAIGAAVAGDADLWRSLDQLRLACSADLTARGASLQRLYAYTPAQTEPALVIAYRLYGDAGQADAIVARNAIAHPGFVPGGQPIQVLTDD